MKKFISLLLVVSMLTVIFASCAGNTDSTATTAKAAADTESEVTQAQNVTGAPEVTQVPVTTEASDGMEEIYDAYDLGGNTYYIMCLAEDTANGTIINRYNQFCADEDTGDQINSALFLRERKVEELFNCDIKTITNDCTRTNVGQKLVDAIETGNTDICAALVGGYTLKDTFSSKYLYDLSEISTINLDREWWSQQLVKDLTVNGKTYAAGGDISIRHMLSMAVVFFNQRLVNNMLPGVNLYQEVRDGKWTVDQLTKYAALLTKEVNGDDNITYEDQVGFVSETAYAQMYLNAAGEYGIKNDGKTLSFNLYGNARAQLMSEKWYDLWNQRGTLYIHDYPNQSADAILYFQNDMVGFYSTQLLYALNFRAMESDFGILPIPKLDEEQKDYHSTQSYYFSGYMVIPISYPDPEIAGALIDALAYYGHIYNRQAVYEYTYESMKVLRDSDSVEMFNLILDSQMTDLLWLYDLQGARNMVAGFSTSKNYSSAIKKVQSSMNESIKKLLKETFGIE